MKVIHRTKSTINHSSDGVKGGRRHSAGATVTRASTGVTFHPNSIRGVINKTTPRTASLVLLPSLAVLAMFMVAIVISANAYAAIKIGPECGEGDTICCNDGCEDDEESAISDAKSTIFSIENEKTIGITLSSENIILDISPTSAGVFKSKSFTVDVSTNNPTGYTLTMTADKTDLSRTSAINGSIPKISTIPTGKTFTENTFENGYWGYKLGTSTDYLPMTTSTISVNATEEAANSSISTITFASKLNNSTPAGTYDGVTLSFVAVTNIAKTFTFKVDGATYTAEEGMTWEDWIASSYNNGSDKFYACSTVRVCNASREVINSSYSGYAQVTDLIIEDGDYYLDSPS